MKKILTIIFIFASLFASSQELMNKNFEGFRVKVSELVIDNDTLNMSGTGGIEANSIDVDTMKLNGVPLMLNAFKKDSLGGAGNIFYSTGASSQPASGSVNQVVGNNYIQNQNSSAQNANLWISGEISTGYSGYGVHNYGYSSGYWWNTLGLRREGIYFDNVSDKIVFRSKNADLASFEFGEFTARRYISTIPTGTPPLVVASTTVVDSLNAGLLDGKKASDFLKYTDSVIESDTIKARADIIVTGEIYDKINHLYGMVYDSTITLSLTQNVWQQVTNATKTLYSTAEQDGITISGDTIVFSKAGGYDVSFEFNNTGVDSKQYHYRILQKNGTTTVRSYNKYASTGTQVVRIEKAYVHVAAGSKVWCEIMSPSSAPGSITIQGAKVYAMQKYLEK